MMELRIAGGCGEHGRNCFLVKGETLSFLVDCGYMAGEANGYPRLSAQDIAGLDFVFLTHSHADHTGSLPWLWEGGFHGPVIATAATLSQLPFPVENAAALERIAPNRHGNLNGLKIQWGRTGHCIGSVWYRFTLEGKTIFFSGDYVEDTLVYDLDAIRNQTADLAVLDSAYGTHDQNYGDACRELVEKTRALLKPYGILFFPVPKFGRGLELLALFTENGIPCYGDEHLCSVLSRMAEDAVWYRQTSLTVQPYTEKITSGVVFLSDPQLKRPQTRRIATALLEKGAHGVMTGTAEPGGYSAALLAQGNMTYLRYPVHLSHHQMMELAKKNQFKETVPYHSPEFKTENTFRL